MYTLLKLHLKASSKFDCRFFPTLASPTSIIPNPFAVYSPVHFRNPNIGFPILLSRRSSNVYRINWFVWFDRHTTTPPHNLLNNIRFFSTFSVSSLLLCEFFASLVSVRPIAAVSVASICVPPICRVRGCVCVWICIRTKNTYEGLYCDLAASILCSLEVAICRQNYTLASERSKRQILLPFTQINTLARRT